MADVVLTNTLKRYKAIVVRPKEKVPYNYHEIAGANLPKGKSYSIAISKSLLDQPELCNKLAKQAERCLFEAFKEQLQGGY